MVRSLQVVDGFKPQKYKESLFTAQLKKQIRQLKHDLQTKDHQLHTLRTHPKHTTKREHDSDIQAYQQECTRLRTCLETQILENQTLNQRLLSFQ